MFCDGIKDTFSLIVASSAENGRVVHVTGTPGWFQFHTETNTYIFTSE